MTNFFFLYFISIVGGAASSNPEDPWAGTLQWGSPQHKGSSLSTSHPSSGVCVKEEQSHDWLQITRTSNNLSDIELPSGSLYLFWGSKEHSIAQGYILNGI